MLREASVVWQGRRARGGRLTMIEVYHHHGMAVFVDSALKGTHREHCLCFQCSKFAPGTAANCPRAQELYEFCVRQDMTTPVFECPVFEQA